jgi:CRISPR-associated protein Cas6
MNFLEIQFSLQGKTLPADHGYSLYSAVKKNVLEGQNLPPEVLLSTVPGIPDRDGMIYLNRASRLRVRCPAEQVQQWYRLFQNVVLEVRGHLIRLVQPRLSLLQPSTTLKARLVTFRLEQWNTAEAPVYFLESCQKALKHLEIEAQTFIDSNSNGDLALRALKIKNKSESGSQWVNVLGYGIIVEGLSEEDSIKLQCYGLGGRKHFGCGWFYPVKEESDENAN